MALITDPSTFQSDPMFHWVQPEGFSAAQGNPAMENLAMQHLTRVAHHLQTEN